MSIAMLVLTGLLAAPAPHTADWLVTPDRTWIGKDWWANRLQDWAIEDGALVCLQAGNKKPLRTAHWITRSIDTAEGSVNLSVDIAPADRGSVTPPSAFSGFLIGTGGEHVDYRLSALAHHLPAPDGGLLAVVDGDGVVALRRFDQPFAGKAIWSINTEVALNSLPLLEGQTRTGDGFQGKSTRRCRLELHVEGRIVALKARGDHGGVISTAVATVGDANLLDGAVAMVSSSGPAAAKGRGFAFSHLHGSGGGLLHHPDRAYGPVLCTLYTVDQEMLKLTAQFGPMGEGHMAWLDMKNRDSWHQVATSAIDPDSDTATFRVNGIKTFVDAPFQVRFREPGAAVDSTYEGVIKARPVDGHLDLAALNCQKVYTGGLQWNHDGIWMPHVETTTAVSEHKPDLLFFAGDQIYEGDFVPVDSRGGKITINDYLYKWLRFCWSFGDLTRSTPSVVIPDDHDVNHGNIWGAGGRKAVKREGMTAQDAGGYKMPPRFVNAVHRTQTSHLPDSTDNAPIEQGITTYHCDLELGGVSFIVLADRMFKESPAVACPAGKFKNGWPQAEGFDAKTQGDNPDAPLLGDRQEAFLEDWATRQDDRWASCVLSQTIFANMATLPPGANSGGVLPGLGFPERDEYPENWHFATDGDSNGWPQSGRNRALASMRKAGTVHVAGDQHLGSLVEYGVDAHGDAGWGFCVPAISNTWPRRWWPPYPGENRKEGAPRYTGEYEDGFGNMVRVHAVANPMKSGRLPANLHNRMPGYGMVRFDKPSGTVTFECWKRPQLGIDEDPVQYPGWPVTAPLPKPSEPGIGSITQLTFPERFAKAGESYISPDGSKVIFQAVPTPPEGDEPSEHYDMYIADLVAGDDPAFELQNIRRLNAAGSANTCGWFHPSDSGLVLYASTIKPPPAQDAPGYQRASGKYRWAFPQGMRIVKQRIDSPDAQPQPLVGDDVSYQAEGSWSPNGRHVLYTDLATGDGDIYVHDLVSGRTTQLVGAPGYDGGPFFSPDGKRITWRGDRRRNDLLQIFVGELAFDDTGAITGLNPVFQLTDDEHVNWAPFWHPDGQRLVFATSRVGHHNYEVFEIDATAGNSTMPARYGTTSRRVTNGDGFDGLPAFNPDGTLMIWTGQRGEDRSSQLFIAPFVEASGHGTSETTSATEQAH